MANTLEAYASDDDIVPPWRIRKLQMAKDETKRVQDEVITEKSRGINEEGMVEEPTPTDAEPAKRIEFNTVYMEDGLYINP